METTAIPQQSYEEEKASIISGVEIPGMYGDAGTAWRQGRIDSYDFVVTQLPTSKDAWRTDVTELDATTWNQSIVGFMNDSDNNIMEDSLGWEWAQHVGLPAIILPRIPMDPSQSLQEQHRGLIEYASRISQNLTLFRRQIWIPVELNPRALEMFGQVHKYLDYATSVGILLELPPVAQKGGEQHLHWLHGALGLPIRALRLRCNQFLTNKKGFPTLCKWHQPLVTHLFQRIGRKLRVLVTGPACHSPVSGGGAIAAGGDPAVAPSPLRFYNQYIQHWRNRPAIRVCLDTDAARMEEDYLDILQRPLQPLRDDLDNGTYETFEKDPVKYARYQEALELAFGDFSAANSSNPAASIVVFVVGAGRGPLVTCALEAYSSLRSRLPGVGVPPLRVFAVEKNASAVLYLKSLAHVRPLWQQHGVRVVQSDLRDLKLHMTEGLVATHVVSELLGSFACNELSPECLQGLFSTPVVNQSTVSIPSQYTAWIAPVTSTKLWQEVRAQALYPNSTETACLGRTVAWDTPYVVRAHGASQTHPEQACWEFRHPEKQYSMDVGNEHAKTKSALSLQRSATLTFGPLNEANYGYGCGSGFGPLDQESPTMENEASRSNNASGTSIIIHGLLGTFTTELYRSPTSNKVVHLSTAPSSFSTGMFSWFPLFFGIPEPLVVPTAGARLVADIRRRVDAQQQKVWYEWSLAVLAEGGKMDGSTIAHSSGILNPGGRSYHVAM